MELFYYSARTTTLCRPLGDEYTQIPFPAIQIRRVGDTTAIFMPSWEDQSVTYAYVCDVGENYINILEPITRRLQNMPLCSRINIAPSGVIYMVSNADMTLHVANDTQIKSTSLSHCCDSGYPEFVCSSPGGGMFITGSKYRNTAIINVSDPVPKLHIIEEFPEPYHAFMRDNNIAMKFTESSNLYIADLRSSTVTRLENANKYTRRPSHSAFMTDNLIVSMFKDDDLNLYEDIHDIRSGTALVSQRFLYELAPSYWGVA